MPTVVVPQQGPSVKAEGYSGAFSLNTNREMFGGGLADAAGAAAKGLDQAAKEGLETLKRETERSDQIKLLEAEKKINTWQQENVYDPKTGALAKRGGDAEGVAKDVGQRYEEYAKQVMEEAGVSNAGRPRLTGFTQAYGARLNASIGAHETSQMEAYRKGLLQSGITDGINNAIINSADPTRVATERNNIVAKVQALGQASGWDAAEIASVVKDNISKMHAGIIDRMIANTQDLAAQGYLKEHADEISDGKVLARLEKEVQATSTLRVSQREADRIWQMSGGDLASAMKAASQIDDTSVRDATEARLLKKHSVDLAVRADVEKDAYSQARALLGAGVSYADIPENIKSNLTPAADRQLAAGTHERHNAAIEETLNNHLADYFNPTREGAANPDAVLELDLVALQPHMSAEQLKRWQGVQAKLKAEDPREVRKIKYTNASETEASKLISLLQVRDTSANGAKNPAKDAKIVASSKVAMEAMRDVIRDWHESNPGPMPRELIAQHVYRMRTEVETPSKWFGYDSATPNISAAADRKAAARITEKGIPDAARALGLTEDVFRELWKEAGKRNIPQTFKSFEDQLAKRRATKEGGQ